jgi:hypothetical protein
MVSSILAAPGGAFGIIAVCMALFVFMLAGGLRAVLKIGFIVGGLYCCTLLAGHLHLIQIAAP